MHANPPKYEYGDKVSALYNPLIKKPAIITDIEAVYTYTVTFESGGTARLKESEVFPPKQSIEEAWDSVLLLIGMRTTFSPRPGSDDIRKIIFDRETRHQAYRILGAAGLSIEEETKARIRRLIEIAESMR